MRRVPLDENVPVGLRSLLAGHDVVTTQYQGWKGLANGRLLAAAEAAGFEVFITADQNLSFQQSVGDRALAIVMIPSTGWSDIKRIAAIIESAVDRAKPGAVVKVKVPDQGPPSEGDS